MKNQWTRYLKKVNPTERAHKTSFISMLYALTKEGEKKQEQLMTDMHKESANTGKWTGSDMLLPVKNLPTRTISSKTKSSKTFTEKRNSVQEMNGVDYVELCRWTTGRQVREDEVPNERDYVVLLGSNNGLFVLRYHVAGEEIFEVEVDSQEEAEWMIQEDNITTEQLFPDEQNMQWVKEFLNTKQENYSLV